MHPETTPDNGRRFWRSSCLGLLAIWFVGAWPLSAAAQSEEVAPAASGEPAAVPVPMREFARMTSGEWRLGTVQADRWAWGPGRHSIRSHTTGFGGDGKPWRELVIYYWRPDLKEIRMLSFHPDIPGIGRGVGEGVFEFDGDSAAASIVLHQPGQRSPVRRSMASRWTFADPDHYHEVLLEDGGAGMAPLAEWDYERSMELTSWPAPAPGAAPTPSGNIGAFVALLGDWESSGDQERRIRSSFEWMEYLDVVALRVESVAGDEEAEHVLDAYLFHHLGSDELRCLALSASGGVYEGGVTALEDDSLEIDLRGSEGDRPARFAVRLDHTPGQRLRQRVWSVDEAGRRLLHDMLVNRLD